MHCHILPGVDDGARDLNASLRMLEAARAVGVTSMVCTPHARSPYFDYEKMVAAYQEFSAAAAKAAPEVHVAMGFEVAHRKLMQLGVEEWAPYLRFAETEEFLLELDTGCVAADFQEYERTIYTLQGMGFTVIIAHPERYRAIQKDIQIARNLVNMGCSSRHQPTSSPVAALAAKRSPRSACSRRSSTPTSRATPTSPSTTRFSTELAATTSSAESTSASAFCRSSWHWPQAVRSFENGQGPGGTSSRGPLLWQLPSVSRYRFTVRGHASAIKLRRAAAPCTNTAFPFMLGANPGRNLYTILFFALNSRLNACCTMANGQFPKPQVEGSA